jgi:hypothetical protein
MFALDAASLQMEPHSRHCLSLETVDLESTGGLPRVDISPFAFCETAMVALAFGDPALHSRLEADQD